MADISDVVSELRTLAVGNETTTNGFDKIKTFVYDRVSFMNDDRDKNYPVLLVESNPAQVILQVNTKFLPKRKSYTLNLHLYDTYSETDKGTTALEIKQAALDLIMDQYTAQITQRVIDVSPETRPWKIVGNRNGIFNRDQHNDKVIEVSRTITIEIFTDCSVGTFDL